MRSYKWRNPWELGSRKAGRNRQAYRHERCCPQGGPPEHFGYRLACLGAASPVDSLLERLKAQGTA
jgi:hypothetical protein